MPRMDHIKGPYGKFWMISWGKRLLQICYYTYKQDERLTKRRIQSVGFYTRVNVTRRLVLYWS